MENHITRHFRVRVSETRFPGQPNCSECGTLFISKSFRVQQKASGKRWVTTDFLCAPCATTLYAA